MDYDEFDTSEPHDLEYADDEEESHLPVRRTPVTVSLSWQQIAFILAVNAIISLVISLAVVIVAGSRPPSQPASALLPEAAVTKTEPSPIAEAGDETSQAEPSIPDATASPAGASIPTAEPVSGETGPEETPVEATFHVVQPGDTLGSIASTFDVSLEDLMQANGIANPDYVQVGQELLVPIGGLPPATPTFTPVPVPTDTPLPFNPPTPLPSGTVPPAEPAATTGPTPTPVPTLASASGSEVRLVLQVLNPGDLQNEMVQIVNQGPFVRLTDWTLSDEEGHTYTFPDFSLWGGGAINIHTAGGSNTTTDLHWDQPSAVWQAGSLIVLRDAEGEVFVTVAVPEQ
jgi:LysM repeat protein